MHRLAVIALLLLTPACSHDTLRAAPTTATATVDTRPQRSLAEVFADAPTWPGRPWTRDGAQVSREALTLARGPEHCGWQDALFLGGEALSLSRDDARGLHFARDPRGVLTHAPHVRVQFRADAELPADAVDTGLSQGRVQLWTAASDGGAYVYLVNADDRGDAERWVRGGGACA